ncbi:MAG: hypothetical protein LBU40_03910, partial [Methanobrevibacter sp.]|nr:hypothetical protein [Methanobrevibacter sp.]
LKQAQKKLEESIKELKGDFVPAEKIITEIERLSKDLENYDKKLEDYYSKIDSIKNKKNISDDDFEKMFKLSDDGDKLFDKREKIIEEIREKSDKLEEFNEQSEKESDKLNQVYLKALSQGAVETLEGIEDLDEFIDNLQAVDVIILQNLPNLTLLCMTGKSREAEKLVSKQIDYSVFGDDNKDFHGNKNR